MVKINRAHQDPDKICEVTFQRKQFSWTTKVKKTANGWYIPEHMRPNLQNPLEAWGWQRAKTIAGVALSGRMWDFTRGAKHYHADYVSPKWAVSMKPVHQIGKHIFYIQVS
jgi:spore germination cell wall hydrolase CwlJ-like protein